MRKSGLPGRGPGDPHQPRPRSLYRVPGGPYRPAGDSSRDPLCSGGSGGAGKDPEGSGGVWQHGKVGRSSHAEKSKTLPQTEGPSFAEGPPFVIVLLSSSCLPLRAPGGRGEKRSSVGRFSHFSVKRDVSPYPCPFIRVHRASSLAAYGGAGHFLRTAVRERAPQKTAPR